MKFYLKYLIFLLIIALPIISGCISNENIVVCNKPYILVGTECCLDQNDNSICDKDETLNEETEKVIEETKEYAANFEVTCLLKSYSYDSKRFSIEDISYKITNQKDPLDDLKIKFEIYQDENKIVESNQIKLLENGEKINYGETKRKRKYLGLDSYPSLVGKSNFPLLVKIYLYQGEELLNELNKTYFILYTEGKLPPVYPGVNKDIIISKNYLDNNWVFNPPYSFNYENIAQRIATDGKLEFTIKTNSDYFGNEYYEYKLYNKGTEPIKRDFVLDYYCYDELDGVSYSYLIYDFHGYLDDLYKFEVDKKKYDSLPEIIQPGEKILRTIPKMNCQKHILLLRKDNSYYVRGF